VRRWDRQAREESVGSGRCPHCCPASLELGGRWKRTAQALLKRPKAVASDATLAALGVGLLERQHLAALLPGELAHSIFSLLSLKQVRPWLAVHSLEGKAIQI